ncbi:hypothetical protein LPH50_09435 [Xylella taiwanensis]|uniref:Uncharacterized protein n=1 Tax=Xylella taiwanensis TaxID=1444770 RepID=Z9JLR4_9GAMM|nr:hypothetical protein [Xylella taiwanensis]EWS78771.1 hypothetical protein AF72_04160 [Xylella taiwanensis]MCD8456163.1 hypothetical protein [Xylella taiwanensis]MCD8458571.1 hypothetical protein [Xylella taiwanensis]MCD8460705.1 hypothetical protein [Xylella taiwanensis]MCD8463233.1 hypothetical protein [Xylella taiwanensis]
MFGLQSLGQAGRLYHGDLHDCTAIVLLQGGACVWRRMRHLKKGLRVMVFGDRAVLFA